MVSLCQWFGGRHLRVNGAGGGMPRSYGRCTAARAMMLFTALERHCARSLLCYCAALCANPALWYGCERIQQRTTVAPGGPAARLDLSPISHIEYTGPFAILHHPHTLLGRRYCTIPSSPSPPSFTLLGSPSSLIYASVQKTRPAQPKYRTHGTSQHQSA